MIRKIRQSFNAKLFVIFLCIFVSSIAVLGLRQLNTITALIENEALEKAKIDLQMTMKLIDSYFPGEWTIKNNQLFKGSMLMNGNHEFIDEIGEITGGDTVTIFQGDTRVATNVSYEPGRRAIGTIVSEEVGQKVLKQGVAYYGVADVLGHTYQAAYSPIKDSLGEVIGILYVGAPDSNDRIAQIKQETIIGIMIDSFIVVVLVFVVLFFFARSITTRLKAAVDTLNEVAKGNLLVKIPQAKVYDEIDKLIIATGIMKQELHDMIAKVSSTTHYVNSTSDQLVHSAEQTTHASEHISNEIQEVSMGSTKQTENIEAGLTSIKEVSSGMQQTADVVQAMSQYAMQMNQAANEGTKLVNETIEQMDLVKVNTNKVSADVELLQKNSNEVSEVITIISEIAAQTQLLALNAAIEAARAGEMGSGFNVVAQEVRKLADQSIDATEKIKMLIEGMQAQAARSVNSMDEGKRVIEEGILKVSTSGVAFTEIAQAISELSAQSEQISAVVEEVLASTEQMVHIMNNVQDVTAATNERVQIVNGEIEEQTASMEEVLASTVQLKEMASVLEEAINKFKV